MEDSLAKDLVAMWQSELTALASDREVQESWAALVSLWARAAQAACAVLPHDLPPGSPGAAEPPRPAAPAAASEPRLDEVERLARRVAELEQRLGELLAKREPPGPGATAKGA